MSEKRKSSLDCSNLLTASAEIDTFILALEAFLPQSAVISWISPAGAVEQTLSVSLGDRVLYFSEEGAEGDNFFNWNNFKDSKKLRKFLDSFFVLAEAKEVEQLEAYVRRAIASIGLEFALLVERNENEVIINQEVDGLFLESIPVEVMPLTYEQVQEKIEYWFGDDDIEVAEDFNSFVELLQDVVEKDFMSSFIVTASAEDEEVIEVVFKEPDGESDMVITFNSSDWRTYSKRVELTNLLVDAFAKKKPLYEMEALFFSQQLKALKPLYPELKFEIGARFIRLESADGQASFFCGKEGLLSKATKALMQRFGEARQQQVYEFDMVTYNTKEALQTFLEYDLGYASPEALEGSECRN